MGYFFSACWLIYLLAIRVQCNNLVDISDLSWTLQESSFNITVPGSVPSQTHLDLLAAGAIDDPLYGDNDDKYLWVGKGNWTYTSEPIAGLSRNRNTSTFLVFEGIDTFASISFCDQYVGSVDNQFRRWTLDIGPILQKCDRNKKPKLKLAFTSALSSANLAASLANCSVCLGNKLKFPNRQYIRKEQSDFGWDWGPTMLPQGIWQPGTIVQLKRQRNSMHVLSTMIDTYKHGQLNNLPPDQSQPWVMNISIEYIGRLSSSAKMSVRVSDKHNQTFHQANLDNLKHETGIMTGTLEMKRDPKLWWPVGYGEQNLYNVAIQVFDSDGGLLAAVVKRTGFRTIVLNQLPFTNSEVSSGNILPGSKWLFEVNGHEIYCKGSNYVPQDPFWPRVTKEEVATVFKAAISGNQNMLRVWASGAYLPDFAYDLADEYGLMLWSEFEFTDAIYPSHDAFLKDVAQEARTHIRRLNHHPSLALWCGNNEIQLALSLFEGQGDIYDQALQHFESLFMNVLLHAVFDNTRSISYLPSSENNGYISLNHSSSKPMIERYDVPPIAKGRLYSNSDYYNYDVTQAFNESAYPVSRFSVEFGFHSHSPYHTYADYMPKSELHFNSSTIVHRNHHYSGSIKALIRNLFQPVPSNTTRMSLKGMGQMWKGVTMFYPSPGSGDSTALFPAQIYVTQLFQGEFTRSQIEYYRRGSGLGERNMGSLYWQLNEIWSAPTWAGIAVGHRWKVLHYIAKEAYKPVIIAPYVTESGDFSVSITSDLWKTVTGHASMTWFDWAGKPIEDPNWSWSLPVNVGKINSTRIFSKSLSKLPKKLEYAVAFLSVKVNTSDGRSFEAQREFHRRKLSDTGLVKAMRDPTLRVSYDHKQDTFTVVSNATAGFVWLEHPGSVRGHWSSNAFWMLPGQKNIKFVAYEQPRTDWWKEVTVMSVWDLTRS